MYRTEKEKFFASADEIQKIAEIGQPILVGTTSVEKSERLSDLLKKKGIKHVVLNAKYHEKEAEIVAQAGRKGAITIATNMAGRGTDILLGGNSEFMAKQECIKKGLAQPLKVVAGEVTAKPDDPNLSYFYYGGNEYQVPTAQWNETNARHKEVTDAEHDEVVSLGGLFIFGTERHEARRIDNQLRGRAGRQGDPGASRFYLSLEDDLMRIFAKEWVSNLLQRLGMEEGVPIESRLITRRIEAAQKAVEGQNFEARKHLLEYDDVMNKQRQAVYGLRRQLLEGIDQKELILEDYVREILGGLLDKYAAKETHAEDWDFKSLKNQVFTRFGVDIAAEGIQAETLNRQELGDTIFDKLKERYDAKETLIGPDAMRHHERIIMLSVIDQQWKDHLLSMDHLREGIGLRGYAQHDPLVEYKRESFDMFEAMMERFEEETVRYLYLMQVIEAPSQPVPQHAVSAGRFRQQRSGGRSVQYRLPTQSRHYLDGRHGRSLPAPQAPRTGTGAHGGRRRGGDRAASGSRREGRPQRSLSVWQRQEIQEVLRGVGTAVRFSLFAESPSDIALKATCATSDGSTNRQPFLQSVLILCLHLFPLLVSHNGSMAIIALRSSRDSVIVRPK